MNKEGYFIVIEGMDGAGKTTLMEHLKEYLPSAYPKRNFVFTREPGHTYIGEKIREILLDPANKNMCQDTELLLFTASRAEFFKNIISPNLIKGNVVICDRSYLSTLAYQGYGRNMGVKRIENIHKDLIWFFKPNLNIFLDINPTDIELRRVNMRKDRMENTDLLYKNDVYNGYLKLAKNHKYKVKIVDAKKNEYHVFADTVEIIDKILKGKNEPTKV